MIQDPFPFGVIRITRHHANDGFYVGIACLPRGKYKGFMSCGLDAEKMKTWYEKHVTAIKGLCNDSHRVDATSD